MQCFITILYCRNIFGPDGRLIEIMSQTEQDLVVNITRVAESMFHFHTDQLLTYWWSG